MAHENPLVEAINNEVQHGSGSPTPTFTLEAQRKYNAFNAGIVKRSALEFIKDGPSYFKPKSPETVGIVGVPFYTSFKSQSVSELHKARAKAAVQQMGPYKPPSEFSFRQEDTAGSPSRGPSLTPKAAQLQKELDTLQAQMNPTMKSTQKYALKQKIAKTKAALVREKAEFSCQFAVESNQTLKKKTAVNQEGLFDDTALGAGDRVLVHFPGHTECWQGPFVVVKRINATLFTVRSDEFGEMDVDVARLQDMRLGQPPPPKPGADKGHFVRNVGRTTVKDVVLDLAKAAGAERTPYMPPSSYEYVEYDSERAIQQRRQKSSGQAASKQLDPLPIELEREARRARFNETKRKATSL